MLLVNQFAVVSPTAAIMKGRLEQRTRKLCMSYSGGGGCKVASTFVQTVVNISND
jgi:hypothetical protein